jgi:O-antigen ligase
MSSPKVKINPMHKLSLNLIPVASIVVTPFYSFESVNLPKFVVLTVVSCILLIYLIYNLGYILSNLTKTVKFLVLSFFINFAIVFAFSDTPWQQQLYGRENRRLGLIVFISLIIIFVTFAQIKNLRNQRFFVERIALAGILVLIYATIQKIGLDPFKWDTTNINFFSSLGNPNFLSAFLAIALIPTVTIINLKILQNKLWLRLFVIAAYLVLTFYLILQTYSSQGVFAFLAAVTVWIAIWLYKNSRKLELIIFTVLISILAIFSFLGILNRGIFAQFIYDSAITSRGDFFRAALNMGQANLINGLGFDAFGDYYLEYRDVTAGNRSNAEFTDSSHNYFLDFFANFGVIGLCLYLLLTILVFFRFIKLLKENGFDLLTTSIFSCWIALQVQSLVSPTYFLFLLMIFSISGFILGKTQASEPPLGKVRGNFSLYVISGIMIAALMTYAPVNRENLVLKANNQGSSQLLIEALEQFPKSTVGYSRTIRLFEANSLQEESLLVARSALEFNKRTPSAYIVILLSPYTSESEKKSAYDELIKLDPKNPAIIAARP